MIVDAHTHVAAKWPDGPIHDPASEASPAHLAAAMDGNHVQRALVIAVIFKGGNSNALTIQAEHENPGRFTALPSLDSMNSPTYHTAGAADRLAEMHEINGGIRGFSHYCRDYAWFDTSEGRRLFAMAARLKHVVSIAVFAPGLIPLARLALDFPSITFLVHHLGRLQEKNATVPDRPALAAAARAPNIWFKISGFHHLSPDPKSYPFPGLQRVLRELADTVGAARLVWGSDSPVVERYITYTQSLDLVRENTPYFTAAERGLVLGGNLARLFSWPPQ